MNKIARRFWADFFAIPREISLHFQQMQADVDDLILESVEEFR